MRSRLFSILAALALTAGTAHAQFIGFTSPQTINQKIFTGQTTATTSPNTLPSPFAVCTPTNGSPCAIPNLGQSIHSITYTITGTCTTGFSMTLRIEATQDGVNWFAISEDATDQNSGNLQGATTAGLTAVGAYAGYRLNLAQLGCASGQTPAVTAVYSGTSTSAPTGVGLFYQTNPNRKILVQNSPTTSAAGLSPVTVNTPSGNTAGALYLSCFVAATGASTTCPSNLTIVATSFVVFGSAVGGSGGGNIQSASISLPVPGTTAPVLQIFSNPSLSITFSFSGAGTAGTSWSVYYVANSTPSSPFVSDPCQSPGSFKATKAVNIVSATTTQLIPLVAGQSIFICGGFVAVGSSATTAATVQFEYGTGASCGTGTVVLTGSMGTLTATAGIDPLGIEFVAANNMSTPTGNAFCAVTAGTTVNVQGWLTFVQQ